MGFVCYAMKNWYEMLNKTIWYDIVFEQKRIQLHKSSTKCGIKLRETNVYHISVIFNH